jgi:hypothetical protein
LAIGERLDGPIFLRRDRQRMDHHCAGRIVRRLARRAGLDKRSARTPCATHVPDGAPTRGGSASSSPKQPPRRIDVAEALNVTLALPRPTASRICVVFR